MMRISDDLWLCPTCGGVRSDSPWNWTHEQLIKDNKGSPAVVEFLRDKEDPLLICRDCNLNRLDLDYLHRFEAAVVRLAAMTKEEFLRRQKFVLSVARARWVRKDRSDPASLMAYERAYSHLVSLEQVWFRNHPNDYRNTWDRVSIVIGDNP